MDALEQLEEIKQLAKEAVKALGTDGDAKSAFFQRVDGLTLVGSFEKVAIFEAAAGFDQS